GNTACRTVTAGWNIGRTSGARRRPASLRSGGSKCRKLTAPCNPEHNRNRKVTQMKQHRPYPKVMISPKAERSVKNGHPWIYGDEIRGIEGEPDDGGLVDVMAGNAYMGTGF